MKASYCLLLMLVDRALGTLVGQRCDLCREFTTRVDHATWCLPCFWSELGRFGL